MTSLLTEVLGEGPAAVATALIPDLHHFRGSFGGAHVVPLWRDSAGTEANITHDVLGILQTTYGQPVTPEEVFAYCYALLATPQYVKTFWDELTAPGVRLPITKDYTLFAEGVTLGRTLIWLHTYGERFVPAGKKVGKVPSGKARITVGTPTDTANYPEAFSYSLTNQELHVGKGVFTNVRPDVWAFSVSGLQVVKSWLDYRMRERAGKKSSSLDDIRPASWQFDDELLNLLWILEATLDQLPNATSLLNRVLTSDLFLATDFPKPKDVERRGPAGANGELPLLDAAGIDMEGTVEEDDE